MKDRRTILKSAAGALVALGARRAAGAQGDPRRSRPQEGDVFVHAFGPQEGRTVRVEEVPVRSEQLTCWAKDPVTGVVRDGSRLNQVLLLRFEPEALAEETRDRSAAGVVAYSGICPHTGCDVSLWADESANLLCSCHESEFDPRDGAVVVSGPAPRRLPALPLRVEDGVVVAAGEFSATIRFEKEL
ncbi:MAG: Rieske (2Fe-2S) protein [Thermoanaerobaculia bacterium]|nr:Rieske (2Fe-2S) protein [Thermoanaerobaculia bacterium]